MFHTFYTPWLSSSKLALLMTYRKSFIHFTHMWFSAALGIAQTSLALHSLARKFFTRQCKFECWVLSYSLLRMRLRVIQCWMVALAILNCLYSLSKMFHTFSRHGKVQASLTMLMAYRKSSRSSLPYIIFCLKFSSEDFSF